MVCVYRSCGYILIYFTHLLQDDFIGTAAEASVHEYGRAQCLQKFSLGKLLKFCLFQYRLYQWVSADCSDSIANALELLQSCAKPSIYDLEDNFAK